MVDAFKAQGWSITNGGQYVTKLVSWIPPPPLWVKINTDGASKRDCNATGCGGVLRDHHDCWLRSFVFNIDIASAPLAELWGVFHGLSLAWRAGFRKVILEVGAMVVLHILQSGVAGNGNLANLCYRCCDLIKQG